MAVILRVPFLGGFSEIIGDCFDQALVPGLDGELGGF